MPKFNKLRIRKHFPWATAKYWKKEVTRAAMKQKAYIKAHNKRKRARKEATEKRPALDNVILNSNNEKVPAQKKAKQTSISSYFGA